MDHTTYVVDQLRDHSRNHSRNDLRLKIQKSRVVDRVLGQNPYYMRVLVRWYSF